MIPEPEENRLDQSLRSKFEDFDLTPGAPVWAGIEARLTPPPRLRPRRRVWLVPLLFVLTAFVSGLSGWLLPHGPAATLAGRRSVNYPGELPAARQNSGAANAGPQSTAPNIATPPSDSRQAFQSAGTAGSPRPGDRAYEIAGPDRKAVLRNAGAAIAGQKAAQPHPASRPSPGPETPSTEGAAAVVAAAGSPAAAVTGPTPRLLPEAAVAAVSAAATAFPASLHPLAALERQALEQLPSTATLAAGPLAAADRNMLLTTLRTERAELLRLQRRTDSLLLALGDLPGTTTTRPAAAAAPAADSAKNTPLKHRWSVLLAATPEQNTLGLEGGENDPLVALRRNHETGRGGFSAALLAEYQLAPRLSVGGGVGYTTMGANVRITNKTTDINVRYDSVTTTTIGVFSSTHNTHSIRIVQVPQLSPVFNSNGQVIRYDTVYVPRQDTVFTTTVQHDTVRTNRTTVTPNITKKETLSTKLLQPTYRFFTVPVLLRYRLAAPGTSRLWTDVAVGAQFQFFLGGTQVMTDDGETFRLQPITPGTGPFRALNVALSGSLALNYALTPRLSVSVAPNLRWQALSLYKPETGLRQQATATGLMFGVRFGL